MDNNRRQFIKTAGAAAATSAAAMKVLPNAYATETPGSGVLKVALIGCGGRGTGAAAQALSVKAAPTKLYAVADVFESHIEASLAAIDGNFQDIPDKIDVTEERSFLGFDAYKDAMDTLDPGDIVILATPLAFRWVHYSYAIERGLHVFMEKPVIADGPSAKRMLELSKQADEKNLKCAVGLMVRHCRGRQELHKRISDGEIGDIIAMRAYRMHGPVASAFSKPKPEGMDEVMFQIDRFHSFIWASGGLFSDFYIHQIDETSWMKNAWPVKAHALGGRQYREGYIDQNFDTYSVEYTYEYGSKLFFDGRTMLGCRNNMSSIVHGSKGSAFVSMSGHHPGKVRTFSGQNQTNDDIVWKYPQPEKNPYQLEWDDLVEAIVNDTPYNEVPRGVEASLVTSMGRMSAHTGQETTYDQMLNCPHEFAPDVASLTADGIAPVMPDENGAYPLPQPGILKDREY